MSHRDAVKPAVDACKLHLQRNGTHVTAAVVLAVESACIRARKEALRDAADKLYALAGKRIEATWLDQGQMPPVLPDGAPTPVESPRAVHEVVVPPAKADAPTRPGITARARKGRWPWP